MELNLGLLMYYTCRRVVASSMLSLLPDIMMLEEAIPFSPQVALEE
jgi:hypothetical protein